MVQQEVYLFSGTVAENIAYGKPGATREQVIRGRQAGRRRRALSPQLPDGYDTYVGERGVEPSGGQKQRISIARRVPEEPARS